MDPTRTLTFSPFQGADKGFVGAEAVKEIVSRMNEAGIVGDRTFFNNCISLLASASLHGKASGMDARYFDPQSFTNIYIYA